MYAQRELSQLAAHKASLRRQIDRQRQGFATAAGRLVPPAHRFDYWLGNLRHLEPWLPLLVVATRFLGQRTSVLPPRRLARLLRWTHLLRYSIRGLAMFVALRRPPPPATYPIPRYVPPVRANPPPSEAAPPVI